MDCMDYYHAGHCRVRLCDPSSGYDTKRTTRITTIYYLVSVSFTKGELFIYQAPTQLGVWYFLFETFSEILRLYGALVMKVHSTYDG